MKEIIVGIADYKTLNAPNKIITLGLGSCVGLTLYDPNLKVGGLLHIMLPDSKRFNKVDKPAKFTDTGVPLMFKELCRKGAKASRLQAKIAGGAQMFSGRDKNFSMNIGEQNVNAVKQALKKLGIKLLADETGGNHGRTMILDLNTGAVTIRMVGSPLKVI
ncbi:MAG: chemotaxis protein CheD [Desulfotomaculum sp.]|nr:chemotaxis protein CheD [Desulfotomaculum sp.]